MQFLRGYSKKKLLASQDIHSFSTHSAVQCLNCLVDDIPSLVPRSFPSTMHEYEADDYDEDDAETTAKCKRCALGDFLPVLVLSLVVVGFCVLGGFIFMKIENAEW